MRIKKSSFYEWLRTSPRSETEAWGQLSACETLLGKCIYAHALIPNLAPRLAPRSHLQNLQTCTDARKIWLRDLPQQKEEITRLFVI